MQSNTHASGSTSATSVQGVNASSGGLVKATVGAGVVAGAILTFIWLPSEYGIDPTGVGHVLGLTEMGLIKEQLHLEADADAAAALANEVEQNTVSAASMANTDNINQKLDAIQAQLVSLTASVGAISGTQATANALAEPVIEPAPDAAAAIEPAPVAEPASSVVQVPVATWLDELNYTLEPGEGIEIKLVMEEGAVAEFEWTANGAVVNHDTHGDGSGESISYEKGRSVPEQAGTLTAAFTGNHGWFWRNRTDDDVVLTLRTRGNYTGMVLP